MVIRVPGPRSTKGGSYAELDDRMLVLDFQAGQVEAFVEIHHRYTGLTRHVCGRFLKNHQDVDEALQETWIRIFQGLHRFNGRYELQAWVSRIATNARFTSCVYSEEESP
jgi:RNA polymerase sigma-70 factor (ECF subfamily)